MWKRGIAVVAALQMLAACTPTNSYKPAPDLTPQTAATLVGSKEAYRNPFVKDMRMSVGAIDGVPVGGAWDEPVLVAPGQHTIQMAAHIATRGGGIASLAELAPAKTYTVRGERHGQFHATAWIEDKDTGQAVTERLDICLIDAAPLIQLLTPCAK